MNKINVFKIFTRNLNVKHHFGGLYLDLGPFKVIFAGGGYRDSFIGRDKEETRYHKWWKFSLPNLLFTSSSNVLLSTPASNTVNLCYSVRVETEFHSRTKQRIKLHGAKLIFGQSFEVKIMLQRFLLMLYTQNGMISNRGYISLTGILKIAFISTHVLWVSCRTSYLFNILINFLIFYCCHAYE